MTTEQRLRDELGRAAGSATTDTPAALARVIAVNRRRQRTRQVVLALVALVVVGVGVVGVTRLDVAHLGRAPGPANHSTGVERAPDDVHARSRTVLTGEWQSRAVPTGDIRAAMTARGVPGQVVSRLLGTAQERRVQLTFSSTNGAAELVVQTSDPQNPGASLTTSDPLLYRVGPDRFGTAGELVVSSRHPGSRWVFSYRIDGNVLTLHFLRATPGPHENAERGQGVSWAVVPLTRVH